ncbi:A-kinase anchor protein 200 isoform X1 [Leptidea sinapis]|uniref:A-kinase anchor protein 200 isoform X1 n=1 Tax=Leptidea sinapis TaxID=189913 RepID=UPI0021273C71|nr:A-kinase anchor protein 200 isoform X1 [Leptidea sinapis]
MGAKQSKRSVDISGKEAESAGEVAAAGAGGEGRMEQIADVDALKPQVNGDAHLHETTDKEKELDSGTPENEKDATTEKEVKDAEENEKEAPVTNGDEPKENGESTPSPDDGKKKKEKVKKKWSLRSISFSRKDKPKQEKKQKEEEEKKTNGLDEVLSEAVEAVPAGAEVLSQESNEDVKSVPENKDEKTPETPVTEPLTNGSSTPETPKDEIPISEEPKIEKQIGVSPEPIKEVETESLPVERLTPEETKQVVPVPEIPEIDSNKIEESKNDIVEKVPASETIIQNEVCVEQPPLLESTPPPLPAYPPPSSVASFAATTMAPEPSDASHATNGITHIAPDNKPSVDPELLAENIKVSSTLSEINETTITDGKSDVSPVPIIDTPETQTTDTNVSEKLLPTEEKPDSILSNVVHDEDISMEAKEQMNNDAVTVDNQANVVEENLTKSEVVNEMESLESSISEAINEKQDALNNINILQQDTTKELSNTFEQDSGICESKSSDVDASVITESDTECTQTAEATKEIVNVIDNICVLNGTSLTNGDRTPPAVELIDTDKAVVITEDSLPPSLSEDVEQPQAGFENDEVSESFPLPPSELCPTEADISPPATPELAREQTAIPQDIMPVADKMADLIPEITSVPDVSTITETTMDVAVDN